MSENEKNNLLPLYSAVGALQNSVENIDKRLDRFEHIVVQRLDKQDERYDAGKEKAQAFQVRMEERDLENMKKSENKGLVKLQWLISNWPVVIVIIGVLVALGFLAFGEKYNKVVETKQVLEKAIGGKK